MKRMIQPTKLKIAAIEDDMPVSLTVRMPPSTHRDLVAYAEALKWKSGRSDITDSAHADALHGH